MEKKKPISEVHNIDCIEYMRTLPDNYFDLAVCDPPYGMANSEIGGGYNRFHKRFERYFTPASQQSSQGRTERAILRTITPPLSADKGNPATSQYNRFQGGTWATKFRKPMGG